MEHPKTQCTMRRQQQTYTQQWNMALTEKNAGDSRT
jgi:hypothetical protein